MLHRLSRGLLAAAFLVLALPTAVMAHGGAEQGSRPEGRAHAAMDLAGVPMGKIEAAADPKVGLRSSQAKATRQALGDPGKVGSWGPVQAMPVVPVFSALLPNGKILMWDSVGDRAAETYLDHSYTRAAVFDPTTGTSKRVDVKGTSIFCAGFTHMPNGNILVAGGNADFRLQGTKTTYVFDWQKETWTRGPDLSNGRWYPSVAAQADGSALIIGGGPTVAELFKQVEGRSTVDQLTGLVTPTSRAYPFMQLGSTGRTSFTDLTSTAAEVSIARDGAVTFPGQTTAAFGDYGSYAHHDIGKSVYGGGGENGSTTTAVVDTTSGKPVLRATAGMNTKRRQHTMAALADGSVVVSGGLSKGNLVDLKNAVYEAEAWDPETEAWTRLASAAVARQYHSVAMLLPDGRLFTGGGGICSTCMLAGYLRRDAEIFTPPYLYRKDGSGKLADRPVIGAAPQKVGYAGAFDVASPQAFRIAKVGLARLGAPTHGQDQDARYVPLGFTNEAGTLRVTGPQNPFEAPPGFYMLFIVDEDGVPSVSKLIDIEPRAVVSTAPERPNLARLGGASASGSTACSPAEQAARAIDGSVSGRTSKWCSFAPGKVLQVDLGTPRAISRIVLSHAEAGGEPRALNTRSYVVRTSMGAGRWTVVGSASESAQAVTTHRFPETVARYVRVDVRQAGQSPFEMVARIYELEVYGTGAPAPAVDVPGPERIGHSELQGAVGLYPQPGQVGEPQRLETGSYVLGRGNLSLLGPAARSIDVAEGYSARVCATGGACETFPAGRYRDLPATVSGRVESVLVTPADGNP